LIPRLPLPFVLSEVEARRVARFEGQSWIASLRSQ